MKFKIPYPPTKAGKSQWAKQYGTNAYYTGKHFAVRKKDAEYWHSLVRAEMRKQGIKPHKFKNPVIITFYWNDRMDIDNHSIMGKFIVDAMKGVVLEDDSKRWFCGVGHLFHDEDYILVEVTERK